MLTGQPPFRGETATDVLAEIVRIDPPAPSIINPDVSDELDDIVRKALAKKPQQPPKRQNVLNGLEGI